MTLLDHPTTTPSDRSHHLRLHDSRSGRQPSLRVGGTSHGDGIVRTGTVTLVGAGPGGADLITVRGARALAAADVVLYDWLADPELLELAPEHAERISVGKSRGAGTSQDDINGLLIEWARQGANVVRLKGGDPFVFGRGGEEVEAAEAAGISCEVIPGVSSSLAAPALAGIPLTHRGVAASFTVLAGSRVDGADHDWDALARGSATLVVLMGVAGAAEIAARLIAAGRPHDEGVAMIHRAGSPSCRVARSTLGEVREMGCLLPSPTVIVIGPVTQLRSPEG